MTPCLIYLPFPLDSGPLEHKDVPCISMCISMSLVGLSTQKVSNTRCPRLSKGVKDTLTSPGLQNSPFLNINTASLKILWITYILIKEMITFQKFPNLTLPFFPVLSYQEGPPLINTLIKPPSKPIRSFELIFKLGFHQPVTGP